MKFVALALILLCINIGMSIVNSTGIFGDYQKNPSEEMYKPIASTDWQNDTFLPTQVSGGISWDIGDWIKTLTAIGYVLKVVLLGVVAIPYMLGQFGVPISLAWLISLPCYAIYLIGLAEFLSNRSTS